MNLRAMRFGDLNAKVVDDLDDGATPELVVVLCHGFGASGDDLVPMAGELYGLDPSLRPRARFVFPEAPLSLQHMGPGWGFGRAWWHLDVAKIEAAAASGSFRDLRSEEPAGLGSARRQLRRAIDAITSTNRVPMSRVVMAGFSQGAMLATDVTLQLEEAPAALCVMSGSLLAEERWRRQAPTRRGLRVLISHGRQDPLLPYPMAQVLRELLDDAGLNVDLLPFEGGHAIAPEVMTRLAAMLRELP